MASNILINNSFGAAQPISTDGGPPAWAVDNRAELGWPSSRGNGWPAVCKTGPRLCSFKVSANLYTEMLKMNQFELLKPDCC